MRKTWYILGISLVVGLAGGAVYLFTQRQNIGMIMVFVAMVLAGMAVAIRVIDAMFLRGKVS